MSKKTLIQYLRELLVHEWLCNQCEYQPFFLDIDDLETECVKYLECGIFSSALGDAMLFGLSNVLHLPIVVFTSAENWPYFTIQPVISKPILLTFLQCGPGHYSLASPTDTIPSEVVQLVSDAQSQSPKVISCSCGRGRNSGDKQKQNCFRFSLAVLVYKIKRHAQRSVLVSIVTTNMEKNQCKVDKV